MVKIAFFLTPLEIKRAGDIIWVSSCSCRGGASNIYIVIYQYAINTDMHIYQYANISICMVK